jgi:hypothetical protein
MTPIDDDSDDNEEINKMPLKPGKKNIGTNIKEMEKTGHSKAQSIAASLNEARKAGASKKKSRK